VTRELEHVPLDQVGVDIDDHAHADLIRLPPATGASNRFATQRAARPA